MNKLTRKFFLLVLFSLSACGVMKNTIEIDEPVSVGLSALEAKCQGCDTVWSILIRKAEAILTYEQERYEVNLTLYSKRDSIIYLSAVNSGFEILRASVDHDSIKVIDRMNNIVYRSALNRRFGYSYPVSFNDLQNLIDRVYLCQYRGEGRDDMQNSIVFEFDDQYVKKRILLDRVHLDMNVFEFYHKRTDKYIMGERLENALKIYSNFMIGDVEIVASGGERSVNRDVKIKMDVNPKRYTFTELR